MADKIDKEEGIARIYQFLNDKKDWQAKADKNGDGTVIKTEFRYFIMNSDIKLDGGNKEDIIDAFWKSIDTTVNGKMGAGRRLSNKNALDKNELQKVEENLKVTQRIKEFVQSGNISAPDGISNKDRWKESVQAGMLNKALEFLKENSIEDLTDEKLMEFFNMSSAKATADYFATDLEKNLNTELEKEFPGIDDKGTFKIDYKATDDEVLDDIIDDYVSKLTGEESTEKVMSDVTNIINAYKATGHENDEASVELLAQYGYNKNGYLNPLQKAVLQSTISGSIADYFAKNRTDIYMDEYKNQINDLIKDYVTDYLKDKSASEFTSLKAFDVSTFVQSDDFKVLETKIQTDIKELGEAKGKLKQYALDIVAENDDEKTQVIIDELGGKDEGAIDDALADLKTLKLVNDKYNAIETKIKAIDDRHAVADKEKFANLASLMPDILATPGLKNTMTNGLSKINTSFGIDESTGNIFFRDESTNGVYEKTKSELKSQLQKGNSDAYKALGENNFNKLFQAAWIMTYNDKKSSQTNDANPFITLVMKNFEKIMNKLSTNPEYLAVYKEQTAYRDSNLTCNLKYYDGTNPTDGGDNWWEYNGGQIINPTTGAVEWEDAEDSAEYQQEMDELLLTIKNTKPYKDINPDIITTVFREAQHEALVICGSKLEDCPNGTATNQTKYAGYYAVRNQNNVNKEIDGGWNGTNRWEDDNTITVEDLVDLTLYCFTKLLYKKLAE